MSLVPFQPERFFETANALIYSLRYMAGDIDDFSSDDAPEFVAGMLERNREFAERHPGHAGDKPLSMADWYRERFDDEWRLYCRCVKRLDVILNHGDIYMLDVREWAVDPLEGFYSWLEGCRRDSKPEFVSNGPQQLSLSVFHAVIGQDYLDTIKQILDHKANQSSPPAGEPWTDFQHSILAALDGEGLTKDELAARVAGGDGSRLYKTNGLSELRKAKLVAHKTGIGYYRPDAPPG